MAARKGRRAPVTPKGSAVGGGASRPASSRRTALTTWLREWLEALGDVFWIRPALVVPGGVLPGETMVLAEQAGTELPWVPDGWIYNGSIQEGRAGTGGKPGQEGSQGLGALEQVAAFHQVMPAPTAGRAGRAVRLPRHDDDGPALLLSAMEAYEFSLAQAFLGLQLELRKQKTRNHLTVKAQESV